MTTREDDRHIWVVYTLCSLATLAVMAAVIIPCIQWVLRPANYISVVLALSMLSSLKVFRGWRRLVIYLLILGITQNCLRHLVVH